LIEKRRRTLERLFIAAVPLIKRPYCPRAVYTGNGIQDRDICINMTTGTREGCAGSRAVGFAAASCLNKACFAKGSFMVA
jgi:hypothetical protein